MTDLNSLLSSAPGGVPLWAWIVIAVVVVVVIIAIVVLIKVARNRENTAEEDGEDGGQADEAEDEPDETEAAAPAENENTKSAADTSAKAAGDDAKAAQKTQKTGEDTMEQKNKQAKQQEKTVQEQPEDEAAAEAKAGGPKVYHITKRTSDGKWQVKFNKGKKAIKLFDTQAQAIDYAKTLAQNQEASIIIHKADGTFRKLRYDKPGK